jgi:hypothetical protein
MADPKKKAYKEALEKWREKHFKYLEEVLSELKKNIAVNAAIRDDEDDEGVKPSEKTNATKAINDSAKVVARLLAALQPDKTPTKKSDLPPEKKAKLTEKELQEIEDTISA